MNNNCSYTYKSKTYSTDRLKRILIEELPIRSQEKSIEFLQEYLGMTRDEVVTVRGLIDNKSLGRFIQDGKILLSEFAELPVAQHEAFHRVWRLYLSPQERQMAINAFKKNRNWNNLISKYGDIYTNLSENEIIEEYFADEFSDFMLNPETYKVVQPIKSFFQRLVDFIKKIVGLKVQDVATIYQRIYNKEFANANKALNPYLGNADAILIQGHEFTVEQKHEIVNKLTQQFVKTMIQQNGDVEQFLTGGTSKIKDIIKFVSGKLGKQILDTTDQATAVAYIKDINGYLTEGQESIFINSLKKNLQLIGLKINDVEDTTDGALDDEIKAAREFSDSVEFDPSSTMSNKIKFLLSSFDEQVETPNYRFKQPVSYKKAFIQIATRMVGVPTSEFMSELEKLNLSYIKDLVDLISKSPQFRNEFIRTMALTQNNFQIMNIEPDKKSNKTDIYFMDANSGTREMKVIKEWQSNLIKKIEADGYENWASKLRQLKQKSFNTPLDVLLEHFGISLNSEVGGYKDLVYSIVDTASKQIDKSQFNLELSKPYSRENLDIQGFVEKLAKKQSVYEDAVDTMVNIAGKKLNSLGLNTQQTQVINGIAYAQRQFTPDMSLEQKIEILRKYAPFVVSEFNLTKTDKGYKIHNKWLSKILNGERLTLNIIYAVKTATGDTSEISKLGEPDLMSMHLNGTLQGLTVSMKHADRSTFYAYQFGTKPLFGKAVTPNVESALDLLTDVYVEQILLEAKLQNKFKNDPTSVQYINKNFAKPVFGSILGDTFNDVVETGVVKDKQKIFDYIEKQFNQYKKDVTNYGLLYKNAGLNNSLLVDYGSVDTMLAAAFVNEVSNHIYESRLFSGDTRVFKNGNDLFKRLSPQSSTGNLPVTDKFTEEYVKQELNRDESIINPLTGETAVINTANQMVDGMFRAITLAEKEDYISHLLDKPGIVSQLTGQEESKAFLMLEYNYRKDGLLETDAQKKQYIKKFRLYEEKYSGINENDGQSYMTLPAFKNYMIRQGLWTDGMELVYQTEMKIANLKSLKDAANLEIEYKGVKFKPFVLEGKDKFKERIVDGKTIKMDPLHTLKTQFAGYSVPENYFKAKEEMEFMFNSVYKTSQHLLLPSAIIGTNLQLMNFSMLSNSIDIAHMGSANKVGGVDPKQAAKIAKANGRQSELLDDIEERGLDFYDKKGFFNHEALTENADILTYLSDWNNLKDQVKIGNKVKSESKGSTQSLKILLSNMINRGIPRFEGAAELVEKYKKVVRELVKINQTNTLEELGYNLDLNEFESLDQLKKVVLESRQIAEAPDNIKNSVENFFNDPDLGLESLPLKNKIENVLYALISNGIISFDRPGTSYPQAAITGYEKLGTRDTTRSNQDTLKFYDPQFDAQGNVTSVKPAEIIIPLPDYWIKPMLKKFKTNNIVEALEMLNEDIKKRPELYQVKALRIPNQQLSSNDFFQIKEFKLPTMQNYVLVPSEIVIKVGSDFDIDKLNIYWAEDTESKIFGDLSDEEIQDKYDNHVDNSKEQGLEPIPFEIFKKKYQTKDSKDRELLNLEKQILLNPRNAHHLVMPLTDEIFVKDIYAQMVKEGLITPPEPSYLASYLPTTNVRNAVIFVQGKFAVGIGALGITNKATSQSDSVVINRFYNNQEGASKSLKLLFEGSEDNYYLSDYTDNLGTIISETQSQLLTQFVDNVKNPTAVLMGITMQTANVMDYLIRRGVNPQSIIYLINQPLVKLYLQYQKNNESYFNKANNLESGKAELIKELLKNTNYQSETLPSIELGFSLVDSEMKENLLNPKYDTQQLQMLSYFLELQDQSRAFSDLNASQNSDTKPLKDKQALEQTEDINARVVASQIVDREMFAKMNTQGLVAPFRQYGRNMYTIYNPFYALSGSAFGSMLRDFKNNAARLEKGAGKDRVMQTIENDFVLFLVHNFSMTNEFERLMTGNNSVARRIQDLKIKLPQNLVLKQFVPMLNNVTDPETGNRVDNIRLFEKELTGFDSQDLAESLKEIAETDVELYKDLVKVLMYQSGLNISPFNYRQIITIGLDTLRDKLSDYEFFYQDLVGNGVKNGLFNLNLDKAKALFEQFITLFGANNPQFLKKNFKHPLNPYSLKKIWSTESKKFILKDRKEKPHPQLGTGSTKKYHLGSTSKDTVVPPKVDQKPNFDNTREYISYKDVTNIQQEQSALFSGEIKMKIISGGQFGGDYGGLLAAKELGLETGGTAPKGFKVDYADKRAVQGTNKDLSKFGLVEDESSDYPSRTMKNVDNSDGTVAFLWGSSVGTSKTIGYAQTGRWVNMAETFKANPKKPYLIVKTKDVTDAANQIKEFVQKYNINTLNIAGHRETSQPGIEEFVKNSLVQALKDVSVTKNTKPEQLALSSGVKSGIDFVFEQNSILSTIGTKEEYGNYIRSIFPNSKIQDIVYRGGAIFNDEFSEDMPTDYLDLGSGYYITPSQNIAGQYGNVRALLVNSINQKDRKIAEKERRDFRDPQGWNIIPMLDDNNKYDSIVDLSMPFEKTREMVVFNLNNIHVLGSDTDINGFRSWVSNINFDTQSERYTPSLFIDYEDVTNEVQTINIYSTDKNGYEKLSNLADRNFKDKEGREYFSVEHAYQSWKSGSFDEATYKKYSKGGVKIAGNKGTKTDNNWNINLMKRLIKQSLEQNPDIMKLLSSTGNSQLTHTQDSGIWKTEFPRILMELRSEMSIQEQLALPSGTVEQPVASDNTITYTPIGKTQQVYTIEGNRILNRDGKEVFKEDSKDRNKIFANFAIKQKRAVVVEHKGAKYVVNKKDQIVSVTTGDIMRWTEENGNRRTILELAKDKLNVKQGPKIENVVQTEIALTKYELFPGIFANQGQTEALDLIGDFLNSNKTAFTLVGRGGTGKTTIIKKIVAEQKKKGKIVLGITVAHKAKKVLGKSIGKDIVKTVASALAIKLDENTGNFVPDTYVREQGRVPIKSADIIIVDEASMISPDIFKEIMSLKKNGAKVIFMGDSAQLPPVGEQEDSPVFDLKDKYVLVEKMRQAKTSPIINTGTVIAENIESDSPKLSAIKDRTTRYDEISKSGVVFIKDENQALDAFVEDFRRSGGVDPDYVKAVTFNNERHNASQSVKNLNDKIRLKLWGEASKEQFVQGELVTAYSTYSRDVGADENEISVHNSDDLIVTDIEYRNSEQGFVTAYSNKDGHRKFNYKYDILILSLLDSDGNLIIGDSVPVIANSSKLQYEQDIAKLWKTDKGLAFALTNEFANIQYGYAITSHKAQGSTYRSTYVFEDNILGPTNGGDTITKNKSLYVAVSRPTTKLVMISNNNTNPIEDINFDNSTSRYTPSLLMYQDFIKKNQLYTGEEVLPLVGESEYYRYLVPALIKMNPKVKTVFGTDELIEKRLFTLVGPEEMAKLLTQNKKMTGFSASSLNTNYILPNTTIKTVVHELVHLTIQKEYNKGGEFKQKIDELYKYAWDRQVTDETYGFTSPTEFLAEALSSPEFMQELNEIPYKEETVFSYLMRLVSDFINELLGVELNSGSVLAEVINLSEQVLQKNVGEISKNTPVELSTMGQEIITNFESYFPDYGWMNDAQKYQTAKLVEQGKLTLNCKF